MPSDSNLIVTVAHDYSCPWCWAGLFQAQRLREEFPQIALAWVGYELMPEELGPVPADLPLPPDPDRVPSRYELYAAAEGIPPRKRTTADVRTHDALEGAEYVKDNAPERFDCYNEAVYRAYWERSEDISKLEVLGALAESAGLNAKDFLAGVSARAYYDRIIRFDDDAYARDVTHVPTFLFRGERCAEAPYSTLRDLAQRFLIWYDPTNP